MSNQLNQKKKRYVIKLGSPVERYLVLPGDEDDQAELITTADVTMADQWDDFVEARTVWRKTIAKHPLSLYGFQLTTVEVAA